VVGGGRQQSSRGAVCPSKEDGHRSRRDRIDMTVSKHIFGVASIALGLATGFAAPAAAGDMSYGAGLVRHQYPAAVPVPAPVPVPDTDSGYYVRVDGAYVVNDKSKYSSSYRNDDLVRGESNLNNFVRGGLGMGYKFNNWFRADMTFAVRSNVVSRGKANVDYGVTNDGGLQPAILLRDTISDSFTSDNTIGLLNAYLDVPMGPRLTPYIGLGIGFVRHHLWGRTYTRSTSCIDPVDCDPTNAINPGATGFSSSATASAGGHDYALAVAAMFGVAYQVWDHTKIDLGYRWLHLEGTTFQNKTGDKLLNITIPDQNNHELRLGLRYEIF
jgi:opacity protein-like surface antigen